ncbi:chemotaxis protein CheY [Arthrobacter sp. ERGS1:01]|uniref:response regulator n=1 Tax=Arthrobacter sp. ERGS1:01 TaxID=1704044 RepID=UPI0006B4FF2A|nr:response regulator [Arthrobacter sp. ERGS1:01]ALE07690.1 chemotaxis protein CheY [Arthrobacter sp. ERGS1:01]
MTAELRVLIVDDDFHVAQLHKAYVDAVPGFAALEPVGGGEAALRAVQSLRPDLLLVDVYLPDWNGLDVLRGVDVDAFVLSAAADAESLRKAVRRGALAYLIKPFTQEMLAERLRGYARYRRLLDTDAVLDQEAVSRALRQLSPGNAGAKPRTVTEKAVLEAVTRVPGASTAAEVAAAVGMSRATAQRYLSSLVEEGSVAVALRYGAAGRPEHEYRVRAE